MAISTRLIETLILRVHLFLNRVENSKLFANVLLMLVTNSRLSDRNISIICHVL